MPKKKKKTSKKGSDIKFGSQVQSSEEEVVQTEIVSNSVGDIVKLHEELMETKEELLETKVQLARLANRIGNKIGDPGLMDILQFKS